MPLLFLRCLNPYNAMHVIRHDDELIQFYFLTNLWRGEPLLSNNFSEWRQNYFLINYTPQQEFSIMGNNREKVSSSLSIVPAS